MHGRARIFIEHLPIYLLSIVHSVSSCLVSICEYMLFGQANGLRACHPSIPRLNRPAERRPPTHRLPTMFNAPRPTQAYGISSSFGGSFVDENPLAASTYDGLDPWSAAPSPSPPPGQVPSIFTNAIGAYHILKIHIYTCIPLTD